MTISTEQILALVSAAFIAFVLGTIALNITKYLLANMVTPAVELLFKQPLVLLKSYLVFATDLFSVENNSPEMPNQYNDRRITSVTRVRIGEALMEIPAYARKEQGIAYPMSTELLNKPKFIVNRESKND